MRLEEFLHTALLYQVTTRKMIVVVILEQHTKSSLKKNNGVTSVQSIIVSAYSDWALKLFLTVKTEYVHNIYAYLTDPCSQTTGLNAE